MSGLPVGWSQCNLKDVGEIVTGNTPPKSNVGNYGDKYPWVKPPDLGSDTPITTTAEKLSEEGAEKARLVPKGATLVSCIGILGKVGISGAIVATNQQINAVVFNSSLVVPQYGHHYCKTLKPWLDANSSSTTVAIINKRRFSEAPFILAPLNEQRRIVAKLEKLLSRVNAAQERLATIPRILKRFRQSVLEQACSGLLTADWRKARIDVELDRSSEPSSEALNGSEIDLKTPVFPKTWDVRKFGTVISSIRGGSTAVPQNEPTQFPILRSSSVRPGIVDLDDVKYVHSHDSENGSNYLSDGDLLFTRLSGSLEYVANCAMVRGLNDKRLQYPDRLFCAKILPQMSTLFYELVFASPLIRSQISERAKSSAGHQRVSISDITNQVVPVPCLAEQQEIVRRVEALFKTADALEARYLKAKAHVDKLTQSILAKAFRGELVPQDPNDEPASVLLERITAERNGSAVVKRKSRK